MRRGTVLLLVLGLILTGCTPFSTLAGSGSSACEVTDAEDLKDGCAYVLADGTYHRCLTGRTNYKEEDPDKSMEIRAAFFDGEDEENIPVLCGSSELVLVSEDPIEKLTLERFYDNGWTIGIAGMTDDGFGHYGFTYMDIKDDEYETFVDTSSDAAKIACLNAVSRIVVDKAGDIPVDEDHVTEGGCIGGLTKNESYVLELYTGTRYQDFLIKADRRVLTSMETFALESYAFLHSECVRVILPDYLKSGYYSINNGGIFLYIAPEDEKAYESGKSVDLNEKIILYDSNGKVIYDPSRPDLYKNHSDAGEED